MTVGLVLSGGAIRGFFHLGVLDGLRERGVEIAEISGCSVGAIVGAIAGSGHSGEYKELVERADLFKLLRIARTRSAVLDTRAVHEYLKKLIPARRFEDLNIPLTVNATDINTGEEVLFNSGELLKAIHASMAIPAVFPLVESEGKLLADGGLVNNVPIDPIRSQDVIVSDVTPLIHCIRRNSWRSQILTNAALLSIHRARAFALEKAKESGKNIFHLILDDRIMPLDMRKRTAHSLYAKGKEAALSIALS